MIQVAFLLRMVVVGEGREKYGHVFLADTGTSNGDITGQTRPINTVDFKPSRPFRIVTGSEDNTAAVYEGPPFKFKGTKTDHTRYCQVSLLLLPLELSPLTPLVFRW